MAQRTMVTTIDDFDGTEGAETVVFSFKETVYSVDLTSRNQELLRALEPCITAGTVVSRPPARLPRQRAYQLGIRTRETQLLV